MNILILVGETDRGNELQIDTDCVASVMYQKNESIDDKCLVYMNSGKVWITDASAYEQIAYTMGE